MGSSQDNTRPKAVGHEADNRIVNSIHIGEDWIGLWFDSETSVVFQMSAACVKEEKEKTEAFANAMRQQGGSGLAKSDPEATTDAANPPNLPPQNNKERANSLDERLREILVKLGEQIDPQGYEDGDIDGTVAQLKQAFADEDLPKVTDGTLYPLVWAKANGYKTGQEYYQRFARIMNEYDRTELDTKAGPVDFMPIPIVIEAAKRAAGLTDEA
jgi:hypothetical protein